MGRPRKELVQKDQRFGRLIVKEFLPREKYKRPKVICICDCKMVKKIDVYNLIIGNTKSCGCFRDELMQEIGYSRKKNIDVQIQS